MNDCGDGSDEEGISILLILENFSMGTHKHSNKYKLITNKTNFAFLPGCITKTNSTTMPASVSEPQESEQCPRYEYMCSDGKCISKAYVCDGYPDCSTGEDESNCPGECGRDKFRSVREIYSSQLMKLLLFGFLPPCNYRCRSDGVCLDKSKLCNGAMNCIDGSDEEDCGKFIRPKT